MDLKQNAGRAWLLALLLAASGAQAKQLRLVLSNGYVLPLSADGTAFAGEFQQLDIPEQRGIFAVVPDYVSGRLYITLNNWSDDNATLVYDLANLQRLGAMQRVTEVAIPEDPAAPTLFTRAYPADGKWHMPDMLLTALQPGDDLNLQLRDRHAFGKILAEAPTQPLHAVQGTLEIIAPCHPKGRRPLLTSNPLLGLDHKLRLRKLPGTAALADVDQAQPRLRRETKGCLPNGEIIDTLLQQHQVTGLVRRSGDKLLRRYDLSGNGIAANYAYRVQSLGATGRYAVVVSGGALVVDLESGKSERADIDTPRWIQRSADRQTLYGFPHHYVYRSFVSDDYIEHGSRVFDNRIARLSVAGGTISSDTLPLPPELQQAVDRQQASDQAFRERMDAQRPYTDEDAAAEAARPPPTALEEKLGYFSIIAVLDE